MIRDAVISRIQVYQNRIPTDKRNVYVPKPVQYLLIDPKSCCIPWQYVDLPEPGGPTTSYEGLEVKEVFAVSPYLSKRHLHVATAESKINFLN